MVVRDVCDTTRVFYWYLDFLRTVPSTPTSVGTNVVTCGRTQRLTPGSFFLNIHNIFL